MKETRFFYVPEAKTRTALPEDEAKHALRGLLLREGDEIRIRIKRRVVNRPVLALNFRRGGAPAAFFYPETIRLHRGFQPLRKVVFDVGLEDSGRRSAVTYEIHRQQGVVILS